MKVKQIVGEDAKITKSDTTGVEITADDGIKTTLPPEKAAALTPDPSNPNEYDLNPAATSPTGDTPTGPKVGANVEIKTAEDTGNELDDDDPPIDSAESYKAWLQKSAAKSGLSPEDSAGLMNMLVTEPDGSIDMDATMVNSIKEFSNFMPQLLEMFTEWIGIMENAKADPAQWSTLTPEEQKSIDDAITDGKAQLPAMQSQIKQMQAQMPELDQAMAARKTAGNNVKIPAKTPLPELARIQELAGMTTEEITDLGNGAQKKTNPDGTYEIGDGSGLKLYSADGKLIKTISPNFGGFSQETDVATGNVTKRYSSGPMSTSQTTDKTGKPITTKAKYDLGAATLSHDNDHVGGIRSTEVAPRVGDGTDSAATLAAAHKIMPTSDIASARGVDPRKFAAFQQNNPSAVKESAELTAMLKIAGLR